MNKKLIYNVYLYWVLLMAWQIFRTATNRSSADIIVKLVLILFLTYSVLKLRLPIPANHLLLFTLFFFYMIFLLLTKESVLSIVNIVSYCFPALFAYLFFVHIYYYELSKEMYIKILNLIIVTVAVMAGYSLIFHFDKFANAISITSAYGNELSSFLLSNHEYALYLLLGSQACIFCYQFSAEKKDNKRFFYLMALAVFIVNIILTYSRTALLGLMAMLLIYIFISYNNRVKKHLVFSLIIAVIAFFFSPNLQRFVTQTVLKDNNDAGRLVMWEYGINLFKDSTLFEKLTGYGYTIITNYLNNFSNHKSFHNAYIQVLLQYGLIGLLFFIGVIVASIVNSVKVLHHNRFIGAMFLSMSLSATAYMFTNTTLIMQSYIDSFMLTIFIIILPLYVKNAILSGNFEKPMVYHLQRGC